MRIKQNLFNSKIQKYKNVCIQFSKQKSDNKNIIEKKFIRAAEIIVNQELTEE